MQVADALRDDGVITVADLEPYLELAVTPVAIDASRADHERAVRTLAALLAAAVEESEREGDVESEGAGTEPTAG
jgi:hypothetical protein